MPDTPVQDSSELSGDDAAKPVSRRRAPIPKETLDHLRLEAVRTNTNALRLLRGARDKPAGLSSNVINAWLRGNSSSGVPAHVAYVVARWAALPTNRYVPLTPEMGEELRSELQRTGLGPVTVFRHLGTVPDTLTAQVVSGWVGGTVNAVSEQHWAFLMAKLGALPNAAVGVRRGFVGRVERKPIESDDLAELRRHRERTGIGGAVLLRGASDKPSALTPTMISSWLAGTTQTADPELIAYVLALYRAYPCA